MQRFLARALPIVIAAALAGLPSAHAAPAAAQVDETQPTEAALRAIVKHWGEAELQGEVRYLEQLLAPEYRSVNAKGGSLPRAKLLEHARKSTGSAEARKARDAYLEAHPTEMAIVIHGPLGIVSYFNPQRGVDQSIRGSDVFVYEDHRWRAVYSLHNDA